MTINIIKTLKALCPVAVCSLLAASCTGNFEELNTHPTDLDPDIMSSTERVGTLLPTLTYLLAPQQENQSQMIDQVIFGQLGGYYSSCYNYGENTNIATYNPSDKFVQSPFNDILPTFYSNYFNVVEYTGGEGPLLAIANVLRAGVMMRVTDSYGPIPYSRVGEGAFAVAYDKVEDLYPMMINDLSEAIAVLEPLKGSTSSDLSMYDVMYSGNFTRWLKFANSLKFRMAVRMSSIDEEFAKTAMAEAMESGMILDNADNAALPTADNPILKATQNWGDSKVNATLTTYMNGYNDPRREAYFTESSSEDEKYHGHPLGQDKLNKLSLLLTPEDATYSCPNLEMDSSIPVFNASESYFLMAEAALKGWITGESAQTYYESGIKMSMEQYGASIGNYLAGVESGTFNYTDTRTSTNLQLKDVPAVAWSSTSSEFVHLQQILTQKYIANFMIGLESWSDFRRTGYPVMFASVRDMGNIGSRQMRRLPYPESERANNTANFQQAVAENFGGRDEATVDLAWAKKD